MHGHRQPERACVMRPAGAANEGGLARRGPHGGEGEGGPAAASKLAPGPGLGSGPTPPFVLYYVLRGRSR